MRKDVQGTARKRILAVEGVGIKKKAKGIKQRKSVCGNTVHDKIVQINLKVLKEGNEELFKAEEKKEVKEEAKK
jgi:ribosomal protein S6E (S10)